MANRSRYSNYPDGLGGGRGARDAGAQRGRQRPQQPPANTHSSYEEALRRSNERMSRLQRSSRRMSDGQQSLRYADDDPRAQRYLRPDDDAQRSARPQQDARQADAAQQAAGGRGGYTRYEQTRRGASRTYRYDGSSRARQGRKTVRLEDAYQEQELRGYGSTAAGRSPQRTGYGALQEGADAPWQDEDARYEQPAREDYREQQLAAHSRDSQAYRARPATFSTSAPAPAVSGTGFIVRAVVCVVLIAVCIFSISRIGPAMTARSEAQAQAGELQAQADEMADANAKLQAQIEAMDKTIADYDAIAAQ